MKKYISMAALTVLAAAACSKENIESQKPNEVEVRGIEVSASVSEATKTTIDGVNVLWAKGDKVEFVADDNSVIDGSSYYTITDEFDGKPSATITVPIKEGAVVTDETQIAFTACYPYSEITSDGTQVIEIAAEQDGETGKWGQMSAKFSGTKAELVEKGLTFTHECAYIDFQFKSSSLNGCPVTNVTLTSLDENRHFTGKYILMADRLLKESYNHVSVSDPVASLSGEWQGKIAVVAPVDLTETKVKIDITYSENGTDRTQTKIINGSNLAAGHKVTLRLNLDKTDFNVINFEDTTLGELLATAFGSEGYLTREQAAAVTDESLVVNALTKNLSISTFHEFQYFTGLRNTPNFSSNNIKIRKITLPHSITTINTDSFRMTNISEINNTHGVTSIGNAAFYNVTSLNSIDLSCVTSIAAKAFYGTSGLESVGDTRQLTSIGSYAFQKSGIKSITLSKVTQIETSTFEGCRSLENINSNCPATIGNLGFRDCVSLKITHEEFKTVQQIGRQAFYGCLNISGEICLPQIKSIGANAFFNTGITSVDMTDAPITELPDNCLSSCGSLKKVIVSASVEKIGSYIFSNCTSLSEIHILSTSQATLGTDAFTGLADDYIIYVPKGCAGAYKAADGWSAYADHIQEEQ